MKYCYFNGKIMPEKKARISLRDIGVLRAYAVFEFLRTYNGKLFLFDEHWKRFNRSAKALRIKTPISKKQFLFIIKKLLKKNGRKEANIRIILTGGKISSDGLSCTHNQPTFFILIEKPHKYSPHLYKNGIRVITYEHRRELPELKTTDYLMAVKLQSSRQKAKATEIIYVFGGRALEAATSNLFIFKKNILITPKNNILIGATRNLVIQLAKRHFRVEERDILIKEMFKADEMFITATTKEIMPVVMVDNTKIGHGRVGANTKTLMTLFQNYRLNYY